MFKHRKKVLTYSLIAIMLLSTGFVIGVSSNGSDPTWDETLGLFNVHWFNASTGVNAPNYYRNGQNYTEWIESISGGVTDHGDLTGLGDDDHSLYFLQDGSEELTGNLTTTESVNTADLNFTSEFYYNDENRTDLLVNPASSCSYIMDFDGATYTATNTSTGQREFSSETNASDVFQSCADQLETRGGSIFIKKTSIDYDFDYAMTFRDRISIFSDGATLDVSNVTGTVFTVGEGVLGANWSKYERVRVEGFNAIGNRSIVQTLFRFNQMVYGTTVSEITTRWVCTPLHFYGGHYLATVENCNFVAGNTSLTESIGVILEGMTDTVAYAPNGAYVIDSSIEGFYIGIKINGSSADDNGDNIRIESNWLESNFIDVYTEGDETRILDNRMGGLNYSAHIALEASGCIIKGNIMNGDGSTSTVVVRVDNGEAIEISDNRFDVVKGIAINITTVVRGKIVDNTFSVTDEDAVCIEGALSSSMISGNKFFGTSGRIGTAILLNNRSTILNLLIEGNYFFGFDEGIIPDTVDYDNRVTIQNNMFIDITDGISGAYLKDSTIAFNHFWDVDNPVTAQASSTEIRWNIGFVTEWEGTAEVSDGDYMAHGLAGVPDYVFLNVEESDSYYSAHAYNFNSTHYQVRMYDIVAGAAEEVDKTTHGWAIFIP